MKFLGLLFLLSVMVAPVRNEPPVTSQEYEELVKDIKTALKLCQTTLAAANESFKYYCSHVPRPRTITCKHFTQILRQQINVNLSALLSDNNEKTNVQEVLLNISSVITQNRRLLTDLSHKELGKLCRVAVKIGATCRYPGDCGKPFEGQRGRFYCHLDKTVKRITNLEVVISMAIFRLHLTLRDSMKQKVFWDPSANSVHRRWLGMAFLFSTVEDLEQVQGVLLGIIHKYSKA